MFDKYEIQGGETLEKIARKFETDTDFLKDINNLPYADQFRTGMEIIVPKSGSQYFSYKINEEGNTLYNIALKYNINPDLLANLNGLDREDYIYKNQDILIPKSGYSYYITKEGDTIKTTADRFQVNIDELLKDNETVYLLGEQLLVSKNK